MGFKATTTLNDLNKVGRFIPAVVDKHIYGETYIAPYPPTSDVICFDSKIALKAWRVHVDAWHEIEYVEVEIPVGYFDSVDSVLDMINQKTKKAIDPAELGFKHHEGEKFAVPSRRDIYFGTNDASRDVVYEGDFLPARRLS